MSNSEGTHLKKNYIKKGKRKEIHLSNRKNERLHVGGSQRGLSEALLAQYTAATQH